MCPATPRPASWAKVLKHVNFNDAIATLGRCCMNCHVGRDMLHWKALASRFFRDQTFEWSWPELNYLESNQLAKGVEP